MAQQTINIGASPNDGTGTPLRTAFQYTNSNFSELYTAVGPSGNNIVVPGNATITGDLTVDTSTLKVDSANNQVGIGTATPGGALEVFKNTNGQNRLFLNNPSTGASAYDAIDFTAGTANNQILSMGSGYSGSFPYLTGALLLRSAQANGIVLNTAGSAAAIQFGINDTLGMTLNSTGLGVGTAPIGGGKISALGDFSSINGVVVQDSATTYANNNNFILFRNSSTSAIGGLTHPAATSLGLWGVGSLKFFTGASAIDALTVDASQNVGIGVTPSAWDAGWKSIDINAVSSYSGSATGTDVWHNARVTGAAPFYKTTAAASFYRQTGGVHYWFNAPSGTAGNAITFTQGMTLDASGNLLVGTTSALFNSRLRVKTSSTSASDYGVYVADSADALIFALRNDGLIYTGTKTASPYNNTTGSAANAFIAADGTLGRSTSSLKYKTDITDSTRGLADVLKLRPVTYKSKNGDDTIFGGLIAEEVHAAGLTEFVAYAPDNAPDAIHYSNMVSLLVAAIKELTARVQTLEAK